MPIKDEKLSSYGTVQIGSLRLESDIVLPDVVIAYERAGPIEAPTVVVCHALTGNQQAIGSEDKPGWWSGLIGPHRYIDTSKYEVITFNALGGCDGSTGPTSLNPETGQPYRAAFPFITVRDIVHAHYHALRAMDIDHVHAIIGGSLGGMQVLEWGLLYPSFMNILLPLAVTPTFSDYALSFNAVARAAITSDPAWNGGNYSDSSFPGFEIARMIGMITYRSSYLYNERFQRMKHHGWGTSHDETAYAVESYLHYQGKKLTKRFDANSYLYLLKAMDSHDIRRGRGGIHQAVRMLNASVFSIGYAGDLLYPSEDMQAFIETFTSLGKKASLQVIETKYGHDGFLTEYDGWGPLIEKWLSDS